MDLLARRGLPGGVGVASPPPDSQGVQGAANFIPGLAILLGGRHAPGRGRRGLPGRRGDGSSHNGNGIRLPHAFELHAEGQKNRKSDPSPV